MPHTNFREKPVSVDSLAPHSNHDHQLREPVDSSRSLWAAERNRKFEHNQGEEGAEHLRASANGTEEGMGMVEAKRATENTGSSQNKSRDSGSTGIYQRLRKRTADKSSSCAASQTQKRPKVATTVDPDNSKLDKEGFGKEQASAPVSTARVARESSQSQKLPAAAHGTHERSEVRKRNEQKLLTRSTSEFQGSGSRIGNDQPGCSSVAVTEARQRVNAPRKAKLRSVSFHSSEHSESTDDSRRTDSDYGFPLAVVHEDSSDGNERNRSGLAKSPHSDKMELPTEDELDEGEKTLAPGESPRKRQYTYRNRPKGNSVKKGPEAKGWTEMLNSIDSTEYTSWDCCKRLRCFQVADAFYLKQQRRILLNANQIDRKHYLTQMLHDDGKFYFNHKQVCTFFLLKAFRFSKDIQRGVKKTERAPTAAIRPIRANVSADQRDLILEFLQEMSTRTANQMPDKAESHLPFYLKGQVYNLLVQRCKSDMNRGVERETPSYSYFTSIWKQNRPDIKVRKVQKFTKCTDCEIAKDQLAKYHADKVKCRDINRRHSSHLVHVNLERAGYASRVRLAETEPDRVCSIAIDGADQHSYGLPHFVTDVKTTRGESLKVKLVGLLEHGVPHKLHLFTMTAEFPTGANHIIEVIHRWINKKVDSGQLPTTLFLQVDNSWRENKNRYLFGYLECLIAWGVFAEVQVSFLPVGHTHIDIDQRFSRTATYLKKRSAVTLTDLQDLLRGSQNPPPAVQSLNQIANISELFEQESSLLQVNGISSFRYFRLVRGGGLKRNSRARFGVYCLVKKNLKDGWLPLHEHNPTFGFIRRPPDLKLTPGVEIRSSFKREEVMKRIESEETRINDEEKTIALRELFEAVYADRNIPFHWNLKHCVEMKALRGKYKGPLKGEPDRIDFRTYVPVNKFSYSLNSFVIVNPEKPTKECPFWVGQVRKLIRNDFGDIAAIAVHWYKPEGSKDVFKARYTPSTSKQQGKDVPYITEIVTDAVMFEVSRLNKNNTLGMTTVRMIDAELPAQSHVDSEGD